MGSYDQLKSRLDNGDVIILDGAMGSELDRLGVPMNDSAWCGLASDTHPDMVRQIHRDYISAGAEIITTNTYASGRQFLEKGGHADRIEELNRLAAELAVEARDAVENGPVWIAGSISSYGSWDKMDHRQTRDEFALQAHALAEGGSDFILLEMLGADSGVTKAAIEESSKAGLPVWVALSCMVEDGSTEIALGMRQTAAETGFRQDDGPFGESAARIAETGGEVYFVFHSQVEIAREALRQLREHVDVPVGAYPHCGGFEPPNWQFVNMISPQDYLVEANQWVSDGAQVVGGCCGIGLDHLKLLRSGLPDRIPS